MGSCCKALQSIKPGTGHEVTKATKGMRDSTGARGVPHLPKGSNHSRGNRADDGERANLTPSRDGEDSIKGKGHNTKPYENLPKE